MKIIDYKILKSPSPIMQELILVNLENGWEVYGYPFPMGNSTVGQAMVKYEKES